MVSRIRFVPAGLCVALVLGVAPVPPQIGDGPIVGALSGEMVVQADDGRQIGRLEAKVTYTLSAQAGETHIRYTPSNQATTVSAKAEFTAGRQEEAFGAVTALALSLAGRPTGRRTSLRLSNVRVEGDPDALRGHVDAITSWWDAQAGMAVAGYLSPVLSIADVGRLQFNVWGTETYPEKEDMHGYAIVVLDPTNPSVVVGGRIERQVPNAGTGIDLSGVFGSLTPRSHTPTPNDYQFLIGNEGQIVDATLAIDVLPDGTVDVRGVARMWDGYPGTFSIEGTGSAKFVPPGS